MTEFNSNQEPDNEWEDCPEGTLSELSGNLVQQRDSIQQAHSRRQFLYATATASVGVLAGGAIFYSISKQDDSDHRPGGISCAEVKRNLVEFKNGDLDKQLVEKIRIHLSDCPSCAARLEQV